MSLPFRMLAGNVNTARIPLWRSDGRIVAWALVDSDDYEPLMAYRWHMTPERYAVRHLPNSGGDKERMARRLLGLAADDPRYADHIDLNRLNNRRGNLRILPGHAANTQNRPSQRGSSSRYRGVSLDKPSGKWRAYGRLDGRLHHLGRFENEADAGLAAAEWRRANMPFSAEALAG